MRSSRQFLTSLFKNSFLNGPKKLVFVRMYESTITGLLLVWCTGLLLLLLVGPPFPYCSLIAFCAFAWLRLCTFDAFGA